MTSTDFRQRLIDGAVQRDRERSETRRRVEDILRINDREHLGDLIDFGDDTYIGEIQGRDGSVNSYGVVVDGQRVNQFGQTLHEGILIAIAARRGVRPNDYYVTAQAALRVLSPIEEG